MFQRELFGEQIKPESIQLSDTSLGGQTFDIRDDGDGNLYDNNFHQVSQQIKQTDGTIAPTARGSYKR